MLWWEINKWGWELSKWSVKLCGISKRKLPLWSIFYHALAHIWWYSWVNKTLAIVASLKHQTWRVKHCRTMPLWKLQGLCFLGCVLTSFLEPSSGFSPFHALLRYSQVVEIILTHSCPWEVYFLTNLLPPILPPTSTSLPEWPCQSHAWSCSLQDQDENKQTCGHGSWSLFRIPSFQLYFLFMSLLPAFLVLWL